MLRKGQPTSFEDPWGREGILPPVKWAPALGGGDTVHKANYCTGTPDTCQALSLGARPCPHQESTHSLLVPRCEVRALIIPCYRW